MNEGKLDELERSRAVRSEQAQKDHPEDFYPTPAWVTRLLVSKVALPTGHCLEPCAGHGDLVLALPQMDRSWDLVELRSEALVPLGAIAADSPYRVRVEVGMNYLHRPRPAARYDLGITNPPFSIAERVIGKMLDECKVVVALLEASFLGSQLRSEFLRAHPPDVIYLSERPSFTDGSTGSRDYAWFIWPAHQLDMRGQWGRITVASRGGDTQAKLPLGGEP